MPINHQLLPDVQDAIQNMESQGSRLTMFSPFGRDPLKDREDLISQRKATFFARYPNFGPFFYNAVNGDYTTFRQGLLYLIDISRQLELLL